MLDFKSYRNQLYNITNDNFNDLVYQAFYFQAEFNPVYKEYLRNLRINIKEIKKIEDIPFLPISFFKSHKVKSGEWKSDCIFESSGTTGLNTSRHYVDDLEFYKNHSMKNFRYFYNDPAEYHFLALLPSYLERENSSLVHMVQHLMDAGKSPLSGYYLYNYNDLKLKFDQIYSREGNQAKIMLIGITFALLELAAQTALTLSKDTIVVETGGMKGRRKEMIRKEFHSILTDQWNIKSVHAEYGMTELFSQAWSKGEGKFNTPPWMKVLVREINDPRSYTSGVGGINIIDLANIHSCVFIETQDIGKLNADGSFEIMGRFDNSDIRGCNLLWG